MSTVQGQVVHPTHGLHALAQVGGAPMQPPRQLANIYGPTGYLSPTHQQSQAPPPLAPTHPPSSLAPGSLTQQSFGPTPFQPEPNSTASAHPPPRPMAHLSAPQPPPPALYHGHPSQLASQAPHAQFNVRQSRTAATHPSAPALTMPHHLQNGPAFTHHLAPGPVAPASIPGTNAPASRRPSALANPPVPHPHPNPQLIRPPTGGPRNPTDFPVFPGQPQPVPSLHSQPQPPPATHSPQSSPHPPYPPQRTPGAAAAPATSRDNLPYMASLIHPPPLAQATASLAARPQPPYLPPPPPPHTSSLVNQSSPHQRSAATVSPGQRPSSRMHRVPTPASAVSASFPQPLHRAASRASVHDVHMQSPQFPSAGPSNPSYGPGTIPTPVQQLGMHGGRVTPSPKMTHATHSQHAPSRPLLSTQDPQQSPVASTTSFPDRTPRLQPSTARSASFSGAPTSPRPFSVAPGAPAPSLTGAMQPPPRPSMSSSPPDSASGSHLPPTTQRPLAIPLGHGEGLYFLAQFTGALSFTDHDRDRVDYWRSIVDQYFHPEGLMWFTVWKAKVEAKPFEIGARSLPRFFLVTVQSGVVDMRFSYDGATEKMLQPMQGSPPTAVIECENATWTWYYNSGHTVVLKGPLQVMVQIDASVPAGTAPRYLIKTFDFHSSSYEQHLLLKTIREHLVPTEPMPPPYHGDGSPSEAWTPGQIRIPPEPINAFGIPQMTMRCLELAESCEQMIHLMEFAQEKMVTPMNGLALYADVVRATQPHIVEYAKQLTISGPNYNPSSALSGAPSTSSIAGPPSSIAFYQDHQMATSPASTTSPSKTPAPSIPSAPDGKARATAASPAATTPSTTATSKRKNNSDAQSETVPTKRAKNRKRNG